jgi:hypothetical protein
MKLSTSGDEAAKTAAFKCTSKKLFPSEGEQPAEKIDNKSLMEASASLWCLTMATRRLACDLSQDEARA